MKQTFRRINITNQSYDGSKPFVFQNIPKSEESKAIISDALGDHFLFNGLSPEAKEQLINAMAKANCVTGTQIIKQGKKGDLFFVLESGTVDVIVDKKRVGEIKAPAAFGELALMYQSPRAATILSTTDCVLWKVDRQTFQMTLTSNAAGQSVSRCEFLRKVPLLRKLSNHDILKIAEAMGEIAVSTGTDIIREGEEGDTFYIIAKGVVKVSKDGVEVAKLRPGNFFGEAALQNNDVRNATCTADSDTVCLTLTKPEFESMLGPLQGLIAKVDQRRNRELKEKVETGVKQTAPVSKKYVKSLADLKVIRTIGTGTFGRVKLCQHKASGEVLAMKCLHKAHIVESQQEKNIVAEKDCMATMHHPFVLKLLGTFQDTNQLYMFLEIVQGGELWSLLYQKEVLERSKVPALTQGIRENDARMYASCVTAGFAHIHSNEYSYRDLKPENLLVDGDGYLKIADFGFAKQLKNGAKTHTLCGTPEYLAPELVLSRGHNWGVDYWALGVLIYELLCGSTPFVDPDQTRIFVKIVHSSKVLTFPPGFPRSAMDLVKNLLNVNCALRLGMLRNGADDVKAHSWFKGIDWAKLEGKAYKTPWKPSFANPLDDSNFDEYEEESEERPYTGSQDIFRTF